MGVIFSLIYLPAEHLTSRRERKKADKLALSYQNTPSPESSRASNRHSPGNPAQSQQRPSSGQQKLQSAVQPQEALQSHPQPAENSIDPTGRSPSPGAEPSSTTSTARTKDQDKKMASDEDYMAFLNKSNEGPWKGYSTTSTGSAPGKIQLKTVDAGVGIPKDLKAATDREEWIYISDADEPFVAVCLRLEGSKLPDETAFAKLVNHPDARHAQVEVLDPVHWDKEGRYQDVLKAIRTVCQGGDVRVYRVSLGGTRVEYWVVGVDGKNQGEQPMLVGVKALAIES